MVYKLSKLTKHNVLAGSASIAAHLPATRLMSRQALWSMLQRYRHVIVKPTGGSGGKGVFQVSSCGGGAYRIHSGTLRKTIQGKDAAYKYVRKKMGGTRHIVQRKIPLAKVNGRPFDIRVMVQRKRNSEKWVVTGKLAKIAGPGYLITNTARSGGRTTTVSNAIRRSTIKGSPERILRQVDWLAKKCVRKLRRSYPRLRIVGMDVGLDRSGKPWVIEANFKPSRKLFLRLKDKSSYRRIMRYL